MRSLGSVCRWWLMLFGGLRFLHHVSLGFLLWGLSTCDCHTTASLCNISGTTGMHDPFGIMFHRVPMYMRLGPLLLQRHIDT